MRCLAVITLALLVLTACLTTPQSFKPDYKVGEAAYKQRDSATALKHFRPLAKQGLAKAQNNLGWMYLYGRGVTQDYKEAVRWISK
jgi:TPR repeat protein